MNLHEVGLGPVISFWGWYGLTFTVI